MLKNKIFKNDMEYIASTFETPEVFEGKTILITGCAGFLGFYFSNFFIYLIKSGLDIGNIILLDNFILGKPEWINEIENIDKRVEIHTFDISANNINDIPLARNVSFVVHLASIASPTYYRKYPIQTIEANVLGLRNLLEYYKEAALQGFLFLSSSEIYGDPSPEFIPTPEEYRGNVSCIGPRACYDEAKRIGETFCYVYSKIYNIPVRVARPFNNYGPGMSLEDKRVPADFAKCVLNRRDIILYSDGFPKRTFCYVADAIVGYLKVLTYSAGFDYFNIGIDGPEISIIELAEIYKKSAEEVIGYHGKIVHKISLDKDYMTHNPTRRCPDITKARKLLNFKPAIKVEDGVRRFIEYLKEERERI